jgi:Inositol hexakisphosphate
MRMVRILKFASLLAIFSLVPAALAEPAAAETVQDGKRISSSLEVREEVKTSDIFPNAKPAEDQPAEAGTDPIITDPILIWDLAAGDPDPRNLRLAGDLKNSKDAGKYDLTGLDTLRASGSSTYSTRGLDAVLKRIAEASGTVTGRPEVTVFDLRQEFHGFFDGVSVSWLGTHDWSNKGKTHDEVANGEKALLDSIPGKVLIANEADVKKFGDAAPRSSLEVSRVQTEQEVVEAAGANYVRLTITDQMGPTPEEVDRFLEEVGKLKPGAWVHIHCHAGRGRTTTFMILYDILRNAEQVKLEDISKRQGALAMLQGGGKDGNDFDLLNMDYDKMPEWKRQPAKDRADFIGRFYDFVKEDALRKAVWWSKR